jgi:hypothetical protein
MPKSRSTTPERKQRTSTSDGISETPRSGFLDENQFEIIKLGLFIVLLSGAGYYATLLLNNFSSAGAGVGGNWASVSDGPAVNTTLPQCSPST